MMNSQKCTLAIINANIWTAEKLNIHAEALAISDDIIIHVGTNEEVKSFISNSTKIIDAKGNFVSPGFIDSHIHFLMGGERLNSVNLKHVNSKEEFKEKIGNFAKTLEKGKWITGGDWDHMNWGGELPDRFLIDEVTQENPVWIGRHEEIEGGTILRNEKGEINGIFKDNALKLVFEKVPSPTFEENSKFIESSMDYVIRHGVTSIHHMIEPADRNRGGIPSDLDFYIKYDQVKGLRNRIYAAVPIQDYEKLNKMMKQENKSKMVKYGALKGYADGSLGSHSAAFFEDYSDSPGYKGDMVNLEEDLLKYILEAEKTDLQIFIHAIGDRGINTTLNIFEKVVNLKGEKDRRWRIEHSQHINPKDIQRFKQLGVIASVQPYHAIEDGRFIEEVLGPDRLKGTYAFKSLLETGAVLALGSDWFVAPPEPILTIDAAVNRMIGDKCFMPEERITVEEALLSSTLNAAYSAREENIKGSIKIGKLADIVILNQDLFKIDPIDINSTKVLMTIIGGKIEFEESF